MYRCVIAFLAATAFFQFQAQPATAQAKLTPRNSDPALPHSGDLSGVLVDLSSHNSTVEISADTLRNSQIELVIHRLTIGTYEHRPEDFDQLYQTRFEEVRRAGAKFGANHILFPSRDGRDNGAEQAQGFLQALRDFCPANQQIIIAVDWERTTCWSKGFRDCGIPEPSYMLSFLKEIRRREGVAPIVYTDREVLKHYATDIRANGELKAALLASPLWFSQPQRKFRPDTNLVSQWGYFFPLKEDMAPWTDWTFWQFFTGESAGRTSADRPHDRSG